MIAILATSEALLLDCTYSVTTSWNVANVYSCTGRIITTGLPRTIVEVTRNHLTDKTNDDVLNVIIGDKTVKFIPRHLGAFFPNLESLNMLNSGVEEISRVDLAGMPKLKQLYMESNLITVLENDLFKRNPQLKWISFHDNPIAHVGLDTFKNLDKLVSINLNGNANSCHNYYSDNNRAATVALISKLAVYCPPTFDMMFEKIKRALLKETSNGKSIQIEEKTDTVGKESFEIIRMLTDHENRLTKLENDQKLNINGEF